jgi:hypothetical protein
MSAPFAVEGNVAVGAELPESCGPKMVDSTGMTMHFGVSYVRVRHCHSSAARARCAD